MMATDIGMDEPGTRRVRISGVRRFIADRMMESLGSAAQLTFHGEADATHLLALRAGWKRDGRVAGVEDCVIVALARALAAQPDLNEIGRAHVCTPVTNAHLVCRLLLEK